MSLDLPIISFGKYKDKSVLDLFNDPQYVEWLLQQSWFKDKYSNIYNIVIHRSDPSNDAQPTPEHNLLQNIFLDQDICRRFCKTLCSNNGGSSEVIESFDFVKKFNIEFEAKYNWDVIIDYIRNGSYKTIFIELKPVVGDDYPCILRKMKKQITLMSQPRKGHINERGLCVLVIETFNSKTTTREQLKEIFRQGNILVVFREEF